ncbi:MAG: hypothetical protein PUA75_10915 [Clostridiales bacterium]|nr:hypothetical protein [Clostridiales bacterium]
MQKKNELKLPKNCKKVNEREMGKIVGGEKKSFSIPVDFWKKILKP